MKGLIEQKRAELVELEERFKLERDACALDTARNIFKGNAEFYSRLDTLFATQIKHVAVLSVSYFNQFMRTADYNTKVKKEVLFSVVFLHTEQIILCKFIHTAINGYTAHLYVHVNDATQLTIKFDSDNSVLGQIISVEKVWQTKCFITALETFVLQYVESRNDDELVPVDHFDLILSKLSYL
jgi:hypothetical protein